MLICASDPRSQMACASGHRSQWVSCCWLLIAVNRCKSLLNAFPLLPVASCCFSLLPVASRARFRCESVLIYASGHRSQCVSCCWLLIAVNRCKSLLNAFPLLPVASRGFPLLPVASRARFRCESVLIYASGHRSQCVSCCWLLIAVNRCKSLLNAFPLLPVASCCVPLLPVRVSAANQC